MPCYSNRHTHPPRRGGAVSAALRPFCAAPYNGAVPHCVHLRNFVSYAPTRTKAQRLRTAVAKERIKNMATKKVAKKAPAKKAPAKKAVKKVAAKKPAAKKCCCCKKAAAKKAPAKKAAKKPAKKAAKK